MLRYSVDARSNDDACLYSYSYQLSEAVYNSSHGQIPCLFCGFGYIDIVPVELRKADRVFPTRRPFVCFPWQNVWLGIMVVLWFILTLAGLRVIEMSATKPTLVILAGMITERVSRC